MYDDYSIDHLIKTFKKHSKIAHAKWIEDKEKGYEYTKDEETFFNISKSLLTICKEIKSLKDKSCQ